jgi:hypothetical protein
MTSRSRWRRAALGATAVCFAGCGVPTQQTAQVARDKSVPPGLLSTIPSTTTIPDRPATAGVTICLAQSSGPLKATTVELPDHSSLDDILQALAQPPTPQQEAAGLNTAVTSGITATVAAGVATVDLNADFGTESATDQLNAVAQIVCTLTARPGIGQVQFRLNGKSTAVPSGDGSTTSARVSRDNYPNLIPPSIR